MVEKSRHRSAAAPHRRVSGEELLKLMEEYGLHNPEGIALVGRLLEIKPNSVKALWSRGLRRIDLKYLKLAIPLELQAKVDMAAGRIDIKKFKS